MLCAVVPGFTQNVTSSGVDTKKVEIIERILIPVTQEDQVAYRNNLSTDSAPAFELQKFKDSSGRYVYRDSFAHSSITRKEVEEGFKPKTE